MADNFVLRIVDSARAENEEGAGWVRASRSRWRRASRARVSEEISASLAPVDAELERRYPGDPGTRQPVHTVYVPGDVFAADTIRSWGDQALAALDEHAPDAASFAAVLGLSDELAGPVYARVRAKLEQEPVEDLRVDFEDGYGPRPDAEEDETAARAARLIAEAYRTARRPRTWASA